MKQQCKIRNRCLLRVSGEALVMFVEGLWGGFSDVCFGSLWRL